MDRGNWDTMPGNVMVVGGTHSAACEYISFSVGPSSTLTPTPTPTPTPSPGQRHEMSSYGADITIAAPYCVYTISTGRSDYGVAEGTSFSAPLVSGTAALLFAIDPNLTAEEVKRILIRTAAPVSGCTPASDCPGWKSLNAHAAVCETLHDPKDNKDDDPIKLCEEARIAESAEALLSRDVPLLGTRIAQIPPVPTPAPGGSPPSVMEPTATADTTAPMACPPSGTRTAPRPVATVPGDYDADDDGLIEISNLAQLHAIRYDTGGRGSPGNLVAYLEAFPNAVAGMGCPEGVCTGYELVADLDFDTNGNGQADAGDTYWNNGAGWAPIDGYSTVFDGGNYTISNLFINREYDPEDDRGVGLFGSSWGGEFRNVALTSIDVTGGYDVGGLAGRVGDIAGSCVTGAVSGVSFVGGLVGRGGGTITGSHAAGAVTGSVAYVGGLVGFGDHINITGSYATSEVSGANHVGGLVGNGINIDITESHATGTVAGSGDNVGGLVGSSRFHGTITGSYATGAVTGSGDYVGGLVGDGDRSDITESHATGAVTGDDNVGGLVGGSRFHGTITGSYATGTVTGSGDYVGGLVGRGGGTITGSHATGAVTGSGDHVGGLVGTGSHTITGSHATGAVTGSGDHVGGLAGTGSHTITGSYATGAVTGSGDHVGGLVGFDGGGSGTITGSYATGMVTANGDHVGGLVGYGGNVDITGSNATGKVSGGNHVGGLVGYADGAVDITGSYATSEVSGSNHVGGLVGYAGGGVDITWSYATGTANGTGDHVGGLVGSASGTITWSYATGVANGGLRVGGLAGSTDGQIAHSLSFGEVSGTGFVGGLIGENTGTVTDNYWDTVASGQSHSDGGQGKTTSELQSPTGYTGIYANWNVDLDDADGDGDPVTGGDDQWDFGTSRQYPALKYDQLDPAQQRP